MTRANTVPSPTPASNTRSAGGRGWMLPSSSATRSAITRFSLQVWTNSRYFCRFSKNRKLPRGSRFSGGTSRPRGWRHANWHGGGDIGLNAIESVDGDAFALAQPQHQLAVVHGAAAKGRLRHIGLAAVFRNLAQDLVVFSSVKIGPGWWAAADRAYFLPSSAHRGNAWLASCRLPGAALANARNPRIRSRSEPKAPEHAFDDSSRSAS